MFHTRDGLRLTPSYDNVASAVYPQYQSIALNISGNRSLALGDLKYKHIIKMSEAFGVNNETLKVVIASLDNQQSKALSAIEASSVGTTKLKKQLIAIMEKRWNGSFKLIGQQLLKKQNKGEKRKG